MTEIHLSIIIFSIYYFIIFSIFKQTEYFGSEFWKVNMIYLIFNYENVCEIF